MYYTGLARVGQDWPELARDGSGWIQVDPWDGGDMTSVQRTDVMVIRIWIGYERVWAGPGQPWQDPYIPWPPQALLQRAFAPYPAVQGKRYRAKGLLYL